MHNVGEKVLYDTLIVYMSSGGVLWESGDTLWSREWHLAIHLVSRDKYTNFIENFITRLFANIPGYVP